MSINSIAVAIMYHSDSQLVTINSSVIRQLKIESKECWVDLQNIKQEQPASSKGAIWDGNSLHNACSVTSQLLKAQVTLRCRLGQLQTYTGTTTGMSFRPSLGWQGCHSDLKTHRVEFTQWRGHLWTTWICQILCRNFRKWIHYMDDKHSCSWGFNCTMLFCQKALTSSLNWLHILLYEDIDSNRRCNCPTACHSWVNERDHDVSRPIHKGQSFMVVCESPRMHQCPAHSCVHHTTVVAQEPAPSSLQTTSAAQNTVQRSGITVGSIAAGTKITSSTHEVPRTHISIK